MPYLIDGHNLIPKVAGLSLRALDDEIQLIQQLQKFCHKSGKIVEVYFDNAPAGQARMQRYGQVKAHFIRSGRTADQAIVARLRSMGKSARNWIVVTSDRQVTAAARSAHAQVISSQEFAALMREKVVDDMFETEADAHVSLSVDEIDEWLQIFKNRDQRDDY